MDTETLYQWEPSQYKKQEILDLRYATIAPKGYKDSTLQKQEKLRQVFGGSQNVENILIDKTSEEQQQQQQFSNQPNRKISRNTVGVGKVSGRPGKTAASKALKTNILPQNFEDRMHRTNQTKLFKQQRKAATEKLKNTYRENKKQKELAKQRKLENQKKSEIVQKISNDKTLKKMLKSKNQRKQLRMADTS